MWWDGHKWVQSPEYKKGLADGRAEAERETEIEVLELVWSKVLSCMPYGELSSYPAKFLEWLDHARKKARGE